MRFLIALFVFGVGLSGFGQVAGEMQKSGISLIPQVLVGIGIPLVAAVGMYIWLYLEDRK